MSTGMYREAADAFQALVDGSGSMLDSESRIRITALLIIALYVDIILRWQNLYLTFL